MSSTLMPQAGRPGAHAPNADPEIGKDGYCNARKTRGGRCKKRAGAGTDHFGFGACSSHGGSTRNAGLSAARHMAVVMGLPIEVTPMEALLHCVYTAAGEVVYCTEQIMALMPEDAVGKEKVRVEKDGFNSFGPVGETVDRELPPQVNIWIRVRHECMDRLSRYSKMALDAGVEERLVRAAEGMAALLLPAIEGFLTDLQLTPEQARRAPALLKKHLSPLEAPVLVRARADVQ